MNGNGFPLKGWECDFPGGPVVNTLCFHCRVWRFHPWLGNWHPPCSTVKEIIVKLQEQFWTRKYCCFCSVTKSYLNLWPHWLQHTRLPCPPTPRACSSSCPLSWWCHPTISSSVIPSFSCLQSFPASGSFPMSQLFKSGSQNIGASVSVLPMNVQGWLSLGLTGYQ